MSPSREGALESVDQLLGMWGLLVRDAGSGVVRDGDLAVRWADSPFGFYNTLTLTTPDMDARALQDALARAAAFMRGRPASGYLWLFQELLTAEALAALPALAAEAGLAAAMTTSGMAGEVGPLPEPSHPALTFRRVTTERDLADYAELNAAAYGMPVGPAQAAFAGSRLWREDVHAYIACEGGVPVACAGTCPVDGRLFVVLVATRPDRHRRGFGEAATRKALHEGFKATGLTRATLHGTQAGRPVYERIGLHVTSKMTLYGLADA